MIQVGSIVFLIHYQLPEIILMKNLISNILFFYDFNIKAIRAEVGEKVMFLLTSIDLVFQFVSGYMTNNREVKGVIVKV